jgi:uncharacterized protein (DUF1800 family)
MATLEAQIAHVWRRLGFGPTRADLDAGLAAGLPAVIDDLTSRPPVPLAQAGYPAVAAGQGAVMARHLEVLAFGAGTSATGVTAANYSPLQERLTWIYEGLIVIAIVDSTYLADMIDHLQLLRDASTMTHKQLLNQVSTRPGMLKYLSGYTSTSAHPNQNYARELLELFSIGRVDAVTGAPNYTQTDITEIARALTGWTYDWTNGTTSFNSSLWDNGQKTFLGAARGAAGLKEVIGAVAAHPGYRSFVPARLYRELTGLTADATVLSQLTSSWLPDGTIGALVSAIAHRPEFVSDQAIRSRTKCPVERVVSAARVLGYPDLTVDANLPWEMGLLGQDPFVAPNVSGWPKGDQWLNASNLQTWSMVATAMAGRNLAWDGTPTGAVNPTVTQLFQGASGATGAAYATHLAGLDPVTPKTAAALQSYATAGSWTIGRAAGLLSLVLMSPEFLAN